MKWELDDNARSGFHYLVLGILVVVSVRLGWLGLYSVAYADVPEEEQVFRMGYLGLESITTVPGHSSALERLFAAFGIAALAAIAIGAMAATFPNGDRVRRFRLFFWAALSVLVPWAIWSALLCPGKSAFVKDDALFLNYHQTIALDLPLPFTGSTQALDASEIKGLNARQGVPWASGIGHVSEIVLQTRAGEEVIGLVWSAGATRDSEMTVRYLSDRMVGRMRAKLGLVPDQRAR